MGHEVYICYTAEDKAIAEAICSLLETHNIGCWISTRDLTPGHETVDSIFRAIDLSKVFLIILSEATNNSPHILVEIQEACEKDLIIFPIRIEEIIPVPPLKFYINHIKWLDLVNSPIENDFPYLLDEIKNRLNNIIISIQNDDILSFHGDILILNYFSYPYGIEYLIIKKIQRFDPYISNKLKNMTDYLFLQSNNAIGTKYILFHNNTSNNYGPPEIREFITGSITNLLKEDFAGKELILTFQGLFNTKLSELEFINAEIEGILDAIETNKFPQQVNRITFVDMDKERCVRINSYFSRIFFNGFLNVNKISEIRKSLSNEVLVAPTKKFDEKVDYDIFISAKNLDDDGKITSDSMIAEQLFNFLTAKGFQVFLSNISLEKLGISAYKEAIDNALDSAKILVTVGSSRKYLESRWVKYEWDSFFNDILSGVKPEGRIFVYRINLKIQDLPRALRQAQCFEHGPDAFERIFRFINNAL